jgi:hypothetical protein
MTAAYAGSGAMGAIIIRHDDTELHWRAEHDGETIADGFDRDAVIEQCMRYLQCHVRDGDWPPQEVKIDLIGEDKWGEVIKEEQITERLYREKSDREQHGLLRSEMI